MKGRSTKKYCKSVQLCFKTNQPSQLINDFVPPMIGENSSRPLEIITHALSFRMITSKLKIQLLQLSQRLSN